MTQIVHNSVLLEKRKHGVGNSGMENQADEVFGINGNG